MLRNISEWHNETCQIGTREDQLFPLIGITGDSAKGADLAQLRPQLDDVPIAWYFEDFARSIVAAGGAAVYLPMVDQPEGLLEHLDGVVLGGGPDVDPRRYGGEIGQDSTRLVPERDEFETRVLELALERTLPLLAVCRGCQLLNVARGGTLVPHLPDDAGARHSLARHLPPDRVHDVNIDAGSTLREILGPSASVNSLHHQAIDRAGRGLRVVATAPDGVIEAVEVEGAPALGIQWHPEMLDEPDPLFSWLVAEARTTRTLEGTHRLDQVIGR